MREKHACASRLKHQVSIAAAPLRTTARRSGRQCIRGRTAASWRWYSKIHCSICEKNCQRLKHQASPLRHYCRQPLVDLDTNTSAGKHLFRGVGIPKFDAAFAKNTSAPQALSIDASRPTIAGTNCCLASTQVLHDAALCCVMRDIQSVFGPQFSFFFCFFDFPWFPRGSDCIFATFQKKVICHLKRSLII